MTVTRAALAAQAIRTPSVKRRLAALTYEGVLLFGIVMIGAYLYGSLTQHRHAMQGRTGLQIFLFLLLGWYFVWFWSHGGQTVATKTWHIKLVRHDGASVSVARAVGRYLASWVWFVPALVTAQVAGPLSSLAIFSLMALGAVIYAALAFLHPQRQFVHDVVCGTRLIDVKPPKKTTSAAD